MMRLGGAGSMVVLVGRPGIGRVQSEELRRFDAEHAKKSQRVLSSELGGKRHLLDRRLDRFAAHGS
jgi:hypothetical protein